jgi:hypothetical protein
MIDSHIHSDTRPYEDFENMAMYLDCAITLAHDPLKPYSMDVLKAHFDKILINEVDKASSNGLKLYVCLGIHPRMIPPSVEYSTIKNYIEEYKYIHPSNIDCETKNNQKDLQDNSKNDRNVVVGVGEIGLEKCTKLEIEVFEQQLKMSNELNLPAVVHTPRRNKKETTKIILEIIDSLNLRNMENIIIEHCTKETVPMIYDTNMFMGLTVQPNKLTPMDAVEIVKKYGGDRFLLNSDSSSAPSDIMGVPKTVLKMRLHGINREVIENISHNNAKNVFKLNI